MSAAKMNDNSILWNPANFIVPVQCKVGTKIYKNPNALCFIQVPWPLMQARSLAMSKVDAPPITSFDPDLGDQISKALSDVRALATDRLKHYGELEQPQSSEGISADTLIGVVQGLHEHSNLSFGAMKSVGEVATGILEAEQSGVMELAQILADTIHPMCASAETRKKNMQSLPTIQAQHQESLTYHKTTLNNLFLQAREEAQVLQADIKKEREKIRICMDVIHGLEAASCLEELFEEIPFIGPFIAAGMEAGSIIGEEIAIIEAEEAIKKIKKDAAKLASDEQTMQYAIGCTSDALAQIPSEIEAVQTMQQHWSNHHESLDKLKNELNQAISDKDYDTIKSQAQSLADLAPDHMDSWNTINTSAQQSIGHAFAVMKSERT